MKYSIFGVVLVLLVAGGAIVLVNQSEETTGEGAEAISYPLVVELLATVKNKASAEGTGNPTINTAKMVSVTLTLQFTSADAMEKARSDVRQVRRAYGNAIGKYLSNREKSATDNVDDTIRKLVAEATDELFGAGAVTSFDVEGQFSPPAAN